MRLTSIATILTLISVIQAQNTTTTTSNTNTNSTSSATTGLSSTEAWPKDGAKPVPKPEWLELIKGANITNAPVLVSNGANGPSTSGEDKYCDWAKSGCLGNSISSCPKGEWGLTYDDGPSDVSPILYDFLKSTNQKATLFMIGANVIKYPATVKRAFDEGHEIAIHTWTHSYMTTLSNEQIVAELKWTELAIKEIIGFSPRLFRPPYGDIDNRVRDIGTALGFTSVIWDHDTNDWMLAEKTPGFQASFIDGNFTEWVAEAATSSTGGVSLEHDIARVTVDAAIKNLPALQKAYKVSPVGQCAGVASYKEGNVTTPAVVANTTTTTTAIPAPTTKAPVVPAAASATPSQQAQNLNNKTSAASALTSGSFLTTVAVFAIAFVLV